VRRALAASAGRPAEEIPLRVAASVTHLGLAARLIAPVLAGTASHRHLDMRLAGLWWQDKLGGPAPLSIPAPGDPGPGQHNNGDPPAGDTCRLLLDDVIAPITAATSDLVPVSGQVLWGNVASAVNGAANQLAALRPDLGRQAWAAAAAFFTCPQLSRERQPPGPAFRRSSCCLIYQLAPDQTHSTCGDCILGGTHSRPPSQDHERCRLATSSVIPPREWAPRHATASPGYQKRLAGW
jgi:FhuF 2Fe-2S C-terminal domain